MRRRLLIGGCILAASAFAGGAYAASSSDTSPKRAFLTDVAKRLHVSPQQLQSAFRGAFQDQLNAAVKSGKLTRAQANAIEERMRRGAPPPPPFFHRGMLRHGPFGVGPIGTAAEYLGLRPDQLFEQLSSGKSLAQIASDRGKSVAGLKKAIVAAERSRLEHARQDGLITRAQEQQFLTRIQARISALVRRAGFAPRLRPLAGPRPFGPPRMVQPGFIPPGAPPPLG